MSQLIGELVGKVNDLALEVASCECEKANDCPVVHKAREAVRVLKRLREEMPKVMSSIPQTPSLEEEAEEEEEEE
ncbi:MAG: hypothetical protein DRP01_06790 [Archaeoglobales archaeon]|nr:MAG: hypothetical protein DRP01_06790 [Archaeoglobales archaeon]